MARNHTKTQNKDIARGGLTISQTLTDGGTVVRVGETMFSIALVDVQGEKVRLKFTSAHMTGPPPQNVEILRRSVLEAIGGFAGRTEAAA